MSRYFTEDDIGMCVTVEEKMFARAVLAAGLKFFYEPVMSRCDKRCDFFFPKGIKPPFFVEGNEESVYGIEIKHSHRGGERSCKQHTAIRKQTGLHTLVLTRKEVELLIRGGFDGETLPPNFSYKKIRFSKENCPLCRGIRIELLPKFNPEEVRAQPARPVVSKQSDKKRKEKAKKGVHTRNFLYKKRNVLKRRSKKHKKDRFRNFRYHPKKRKSFSRNACRAFRPAY